MRRHHRVLQLRAPRRARGRRPDRRGRIQEDRSSTQDSSDSSALRSRDRGYRVESQKLRREQGEVRAPARRAGPLSSLPRPWRSRPPPLPPRRRSIAIMASACAVPFACGLLERALGVERRPIFSEGARRTRRTRRMRWTRCGLKSDCEAMLHETGKQSVIQADWTRVLGDKCRQRDAISRRVFFPFPRSIRIQCTCRARRSCESGTRFPLAHFSRRPARRDAPSDSFRHKVGHSPHAGTASTCRHSSPRVQPTMLDRIEVKDFKSYRGRQTMYALLLETLPP